MYSAASKYNYTRKKFLPTVRYFVKSATKSVCFYKKKSMSCAIKNKSIENNKICSYMVQWDLCRVIYQSNPDKDPRPEEQANDQVQTRFFVESTKPKKRQLSVTNTQNIPLNSWKKILKFVIDFLLFRNKLKLVKESMRGLRRCKQNPGCALKKLLFLQPDSPQKKNSTGNYGSADRKTDFFPRATVLLPTHSPREGGGGQEGGTLTSFFAVPPRWSPLPEPRPR